jgi:hypothetical protein
MHVKMAAGFLAVFALVSLFLLGSSIGFAAQDTMDVNITIESSSEITVLPSVLNWTDVALGAVAGSKAVSVKNTGSVNVTQLYVYGDAITDEAARPYGLPNASDYAAASVITINNGTGNQEYFIGRIEWNWTEDISNLNTTNINSLMAAGFFKNVSREFVWAIGNGTGGLCNNTGAQFVIEADIDTGTMATRTPAVAGTRNAGDADYSYFSVDGDPLNGYCVAVSTDCNRTYIYKYDKRTGFGDCTNSAYMTEDKIVPGAMMQIDANAYIPNGIPAGEMKRATLTFVAT